MKIISSEQSLLVPKFENFTYICTARITEEKFRIQKFLTP